MEFCSDTGTHYLHRGKFRVLWSWCNARHHGLPVRSHFPQTTMKQLLLFAVELYWRLTNPARRRPCLFHETCSRHVHRITREYGLFRGLMALTRRFRQCRLAYAVEFDGQAEPFLRLADGSVAQMADLSESMAAFVEQSSRAVASIRTGKEPDDRRSPEVSLPSKFTDRDQISTVR